ncbi:unnamed protein product [Camellia sinensis]
MIGFLLGSIYLNLSQVARATQNFSPSMKIGEGGFGTVYRALLPGGQVVAIKRAKKAGEQGRSPVLILSINESNHQRKPAIVFLHSTHKCKEWLRPLLEAYASRGYIAAAIDSRYHGEHASSSRFIMETR